MRLLLDESLSRDVAPLLTAGGHDAVHASDLGLLGETDEVVMHSAFAEARVLISADTDFGQILALNRHPGPSVIILRRSPHLPSEQAQLLLRALPDLEDSVGDGIVVSLTPHAVRIRRLPIEPST